MLLPSLVWSAASTRPLAAAGVSAAGARRTPQPRRQGVPGSGTVDAVTTPGPAVDDTHPADMVNAMVNHVLRLASTWAGWDGSPIEVPVPGELPRWYTPHKAIRRVADHMLDHLAELEARLADRPTEPDAWHGSATTTPGDLAAFTQPDLDEARSRLCRLALIWDVRLRSLTDEQLDHANDDAWTLRQVAFHVAESAAYADWVGDLGPATR